MSQAPTNVIRVKDKHYQHTLTQPIHVIGRGLHSGMTVSMTLLPAAEDSGYTFDRQDVRVEKGEVPARWYNVTETRLSTTLTNSFGVRVGTVEHLLAALRGSNVDNCQILLDGPEVPILDGSALPYVELIRQHGLREQKAERRAILITEPVWVGDDDNYAGIIPYPQPWLEVEINFNHHAIGKQTCSLALNDTLFRTEVAAARTFGFANDMATLRRHGLALGGSLENAILVDDNGIVNAEGLRHPNEFARHKVLDAVGDLSLAGAPIIGKFVGKGCGHRMNNDLLRQLMAEEDAWQMMTYGQALEAASTLHLIDAHGSALHAATALSSSTRLH